MLKEETLATQLDDINLDGIQKMFQAEHYIRLKHTGVLMHIIPTDGYTNYVCKPASQEIEAMLAEKLVLHSELEVQKFVSAVSGFPLLAYFCGIVLEEYFHRFVMGGGEVDIGLLDGRKKELELVKKNFPKLEQTVRFGDSSLAQLETIEDGDYIRPTSRTNKTFDSFTIMDHSFFDTSKSGKCIVVFQITVSDSHDVKGPVLKNIQEKVKEAYKFREENTKLPIVLVFASKTNGIQSAQIIRDANGRPYTNKTFPNSVSQYVVRIKGYDQIALRVALAEEKSKQHVKVLPEKESAQGIVLAEEENEEVHS